MEAFIASSGGAAGLQHSLHNDPRRFSSDGAIGFGSSARGLSSLARPPPHPMDAGSELPLRARNPSASSLAASSLLPRGLPDGLSLFRDLEREGLGGNSVRYRSLLNRRRQEGEDEALSAALGAAASLPGRTLLNNFYGINPALLPRSSGLLGSGVRMSDDSIRQAIMREQTISAAAAAQAQEGRPSDPLGEEEGPASKRLKNHHWFQP